MMVGGVLCMVLCAVFCVLCWLVVWWWEVMVHVGLL